jgi:hypothetical protein
MSADYSILDDVFEVTKKDPDGKKFDRGEQCNLLYQPVQECCSGVICPLQWVDILLHATCWGCLLTA